MSDSHIHVYGASDQRVLNRLRKFEEKLMATIEDLKEEVRQTQEASASIIALVKGLAQQIRDNATNPAALQEMADKLDGVQTEIAAAVLENSPAPEPTPTDPPTE